MVELRAFEWLKLSAWLFKWRKVGSKGSSIRRIRACTFDAHSGLVVL